MVEQAGLKEDFDTLVLLVEEQSVEVPMEVDSKAEALLEEA